LVHHCTGFTKVVIVFLPSSDLHSDLLQVQCFAGDGPLIGVPNHLTHLGTTRPRKMNRVLMK
jgi:hypothetical protein